MLTESKLIKMIDWLKKELAESEKNRESSIGLMSKDEIEQSFVSIEKRKSVINALENVLNG